MTDENPSDPITEAMARCEAAIDYRFSDRKLLQLCLTHSSIARTRFESNERLEFLGDAIMGAAVCEQLYQLYPTKPEGELTRIKSVIVSRTTCSRISSELGLESCVQLGKGLADAESIPSSILAAVFESLVAGVYLDGGYEAARSFVHRLMAPEIERTVETSHGKNYKSLLQQHVQKINRATPVYRLVDQTGPDHLKNFQIAVQIGTELFPPAWGPNKKEAEQRAAENAWNQLRSRPVVSEDEDSLTKEESSNSQEDPFVEQKPAAGCEKGVPVEGHSDMEPEPQEESSKVVDLVVTLSCDSGESYPE